MVLSWGLASSGHAPAPRFVYSQDRTHRQSDCGPGPRGLRKHRLCQLRTAPRRTWELRVPGWAACPALSTAPEGHQARARHLPAPCTMSELAASILASQAPLKVGGGCVGPGGPWLPSGCQHGSLHTRPTDVPSFFRPPLWGCQLRRLQRFLQKEREEKPDLQLPEQPRLRHQQAPPEPLPVLPAEEVLGDGHENGV